MSDPHDTGSHPDDEQVDVDDPFDVPEEVEEAWEDDDVTEGEAPSG